jgi:hypothetical protein
VLVDAITAPCFRYALGINTGPNHAVATDRGDSMWTHRGFGRDFSSWPRYSNDWQYLPSAGSPCHGGLF